MYLSILFFISKLFDLFTTRLFLSKGMVESNIIYNRFGEDVSFWLVYMFTFVLYFILQKFDHKELRECLIIYIIISFAIPLFNIASIYV